MHKRNFSLQEYQNMCQVIPGGVNSPVRAWKEMQLPPMIVELGEGDTITDIDGNAYIDYCCSWGALIHGHAHPKVIEAVTAQLKKGTSFGISTRIERVLAKKIVDWIPSVEKIRFVNSGTEATMSAARLARGFTGRDRLVKFNGNYHGHADCFLVQAGSGVTELAASSSAGIPQGAVSDVVSLPYNDVDIVRNYLQKNAVAAVILEPIAGNMGVVPASQEFLTCLREETKKQGALLIFDEVMSGFRAGHYGAQPPGGVIPDLTCFGKVIGGGFPVAAFGGREAVMNHLAPEGGVYQAGTLSGNPVAMAAGVKTFALLEEPDFYEELQRKSAIIVEPVREYLKKQQIPACIQDAGSMFTLFFGAPSVHNQEEAKALDHDRYREFFRFMLNRGVYVPPSHYEAWFVSSAHTEEHLNYTRDLVLEFLT